MVKCHIQIERLQTCWSWNIKNHYICCVYAFKKVIVPTKVLQAKYLGFGAHCIKDFWKNNFSHQSSTRQPQHYTGFLLQLEHQSLWWFSSFPVQWCPLALEIYVMAVPSPIQVPGGRCSTGGCCGGSADCCENSDSICIMLTVPCCVMDNSFALCIYIPDLAHHHQHLHYHHHRHHHYHHHHPHLQVSTLVPTVTKSSKVDGATTTLLSLKK